MSKNLIVAIVVALATGPIGMANAAKRTSPATSVRPAAAQGASTVSARGKRGLLSAKKRQSKQASNVSLGGALSPLGAADHPLQIEADLHAADSVENPHERRQAIAKAKGAIAAYDAKHPGRTWARGLEADNVKQVFTTAMAEGQATKVFRSARTMVIAATLNVVAAAIGLSIGHDLVDVGQADVTGLNAIMLVAGYGNATMATYLAREYKQAKTKLAGAIDASSRAFVRFAEFNNLISRTK
ncbi:MAG: hypothetical protein IPL79_09590 [Myxococcales bacterium]|nr:hypothetical protein [Myxococcales bacterium]